MEGIHLFRRLREKIRHFGLKMKREKEKKRKRSDNEGKKDRRGFPEEKRNSAFTGLSEICVTQCVEEIKKEELFQKIRKKGERAACLSVSLIFNFLYSNFVSAHFLFRQSYCRGETDSIDAGKGK